MSIVDQCNCVGLSTRFTLISHEHYHRYSLPHTVIALTCDFSRNLVGQMCATSIDSDLQAEGQEFDSPMLHKAQNPRWSATWDFLVSAVVRHFLG